MDQAELAALLLATFLEEMQEHVGNINRELMALEQGPSAEERADLLKVLFRSAHTLKGSSRAVNAEPIEAACHQFEDVLTAVRDERIEQTPELFKLLFATADAIEETGDWLREERSLSDAPLNLLIPKLQEVAKGNKPSDDLGADVVDPADPIAALGSAAATSSDDTIKEVVRTAAPAATVRVAAAKLDSLMAKIGELLVARGRVATQTAVLGELLELVSSWKQEWYGVDKLLRQHNLAAGGRTIDHRRSVLPRSALETLAGNRVWIQELEKRLDRLTSAVQADDRELDMACDALAEEVHQVRMFPFAEACQGLERAARDVARQGGKQVRLNIEGEDVEIDRSVLEGLKDPLLHLVRNAVDHGIEPAEEREQAGKPTTGSITVSAALSGAEVEIVVADDGAGVDLERIRERVRQKGLAEPAEDAALVGMLFHPNFSTAAIVTDVSGRGVGLDVVQSSVESLHGNVTVDFEPGRGTRFIIRVPLTLTTIRTVLVAAGGQIYGIATNSVQRIVRFSAEELRWMAGRAVLPWSDGPIPVIALADVLAVRAAESSEPTGDKRLALVLAGGGQRVALVVDDILSEQDVVVKNLGARIRRLRHVSGAALLATGEVALVLNAANVIRTALRTATDAHFSIDADSAATKAHRVLVVDDSLTTRTLMKSILESAGYEIELAVDGTDAWRRIQDHKPELVVSDLDMPKMDGFDLTSTIRNSASCAGLPIILVTARETDEDKARGIQVGADAYIVKSAFDQRTLLGTMAQLL